MNAVGTFTFLGEGKTRALHDIATFNLIILDFDELETRWWRGRQNGGRRGSCRGRAIRARNDGRCGEVASVFGTWERDHRKWNDVVADVGDFSSDHFSAWRRVERAIGGLPKVGPALLHDSSASRQHGRTSRKSPSARRSARSVILKLMSRCDQTFGGFEDHRAGRLDEWSSDQRVDQVGHGSRVPVSSGTNTTATGRRRQRRCCSNKC